MVRIAITQAAFEAISATLPLGSVGYENGPNENGEKLIWLAPNVVNRLRAMRGPGESYGDVISRRAVIDRRSEKLICFFACVPGTRHCGALRISASALSFAAGPTLRLL